MSNEVISVEWVDQQLEELEAKHGHRLNTVTDKGLPTIAAICAVITIAVPILKFAKALVFFKKKWQTAIQRVIDIAGTACQ